MRHLRNDRSTSCWATTTLRRLESATRVSMAGCTRLVDLYTAWGKPEEAAKWQQKLDEVKATESKAADANADAVNAVEPQAALTKPDEAKPVEPTRFEPTPEEKKE